MTQPSETSHAQRDDLLALPADLPVPVDDGAADHLTGLAVPSIGLPSTDGTTVDLARLSRRAIVYAYPRTGVPGEPPLVDDWDSIPGARGCTPESCGFRDHQAELDELGYDVFGLSTQTTDDQREVAERLRLPFTLLSDAELRLTNALPLPTITVAGHTLLRRLTMVIEGATIERIWYPVFPPDTHALEMASWARSSSR